MADGYIVYQGKACDSTQYFSSISNEKYNFKCHKFANPADFFMRILSVSYPINEQDKEKIGYINS